MEFYKNFFKLIPAHFVMIFIAFCGESNMMSVRNCLSVAIVAMTKIKRGSTNSSDQCPNKFSEEINNEDQGNGEFDWDPSTQGLLLSVYFYGLLASQISMMFFPPQWSLKWIMVTSSLVSAIAMFLGPLAARYSIAAFFVVRVATGYSTGLNLYVSYQLSGRWIPLRIRAFAASCIYCGTNVGTVVAVFVSGYLCTLTQYDGGWPLVFYVFGFVSLMLAIFSLIFMADYPNDRSGISAKELNYLIENGCIFNNHKVKKAPWKRMLRFPGLWALSAASFGHNWGLDLLQQQLPTYLSHIQHYDIKTNGLLSALPWILKGTINLLSGSISDAVYRVWHPTLNLQRKFFNTLAFFGCAIFIIGVTRVGCNGSLIVAFLCLAMGLAGFVSSGMVVAPMDISPTYAGKIFGFSNSFGNIAGLLAPWLTGYITQQNETIMEWNLVFYIASGVFLLTGTIFLIFGSVEDQKWDQPEVEHLNENSNLLRLRWIKNLRRT